MTEAIDAVETSPTWRLIPHLQAPGSVQMAIDRWLLEQHRAGHHPPALRFYTWSPPAISVGYHQRQLPEHWATLRWQDAPLAVVRRPSGGRAVLHQGDLTYAMVTSGLKGDRSTVYRTLCEVLIQGWRSLGVALHYGDAQGGYHQHTNCFSLATAADLITASGTKMIGSAQLRRGAAILQHGSMRLHPDIALAQQVFLLDKLGDEQPLLPAPLQSLADDVLRRVISHALAQAAEAVLNIQLQEQPLTMAEWEQIMAEHDAATSGDGAAAMPDQTSD